MLLGLEDDGVDTDMVLTCDDDGFKEDDEEVLLFLLAISFNPEDHSLISSLSSVLLRTINFTFFSSIRRLSSASKAKSMSSCRARQNECRHPSLYTSFSSSFSDPLSSLLLLLPRSSTSSVNSKRYRGWLMSSICFL